MRDEDPRELFKLPEYVQTICSPDAWVKHADELLTVASMLEPMIREAWKKFRAEWKESQNQYEGCAPLPIIPGRISIPVLAPKFQSVYFMLVAYALENFFKAAIVWKGGHTFKLQAWRGKKIPESLKKHDLSCLAKEAGLEINLAEEELLRRLARDAVWSGRYPVPTNLSGTNYSEKFSNKNKYPVVFSHEDDIDQLNTLVVKIRKALGFS